jgi:hypothetical protein
MYIYIHIYTCIYVYMYIYIHIYIHIYIYVLNTHPDTHFLCHSSIECDEENTYISNNSHESDMSKRYFNETCDVLKHNDYKFI